VYILFVPKRVLLVYPGIGLSDFRKNNTAVYSGEYNWIHHGLALIGSYLKQSGHIVSLLDLRHMRDWTTFMIGLKEFNPDVVGVSVSYLDYKPAMKAIMLVSCNCPNAKIVVGGLCPTMFPEKFIDNPLIDTVITKEGELSFLNAINNNCIDKLVEGIKPDVNIMPFADRELFSYPEEMHCHFAPDHTPPTITMISGRGCPYSCTYCQPAESMTYGKKVRMRNVDNVMQELTLLKQRYAFKSITWWDDTFTIYPDWINEFCVKYEKDFNAEMVVCSRADIICKNEKMIERLAKVGVNWAVIGFESGSDKLLNLIKKDTSAEINIKANEICNKYGIKVFGTFMMGLPTETKDEALETYNLIKKINAKHHIVFYFTPIPGTEIYDLCKDNNLILREDELNIERTLNFVPKIRNIDYGFLDRLREDLEICKN